MFAVVKKRVVVFIIVIGRRDSSSFASFKDFSTFQDSKIIIEPFKDFSRLILKSSDSIKVN